jgi:hypothetical protein
MALGTLSGYSNSSVFSGTWTIGVSGPLWQGILAPTYGSGACTLSPTDVAAGCAIDWTQAGISGGIPSGSWTQSGSTISPSGGNDVTAIQAALGSCGTDHYVQLATGTFSISSDVVVPSNCALRGMGPNLTILNTTGNQNAAVGLGSDSDSVSYSPVSITAGATAGSTSITLASVTGVTNGTYLVITETNNPAWVNTEGGEGNCTWCDGWTGDGHLARGQIVEIEGAPVGNVVTISPPLYTAYTQTPIAVPFTSDAKYAGVENLQIYQNNTGYTDAFYMGKCAYCWTSDVEVNWADGDFVEDSWGYKDEIVNSYFSNAFAHGPGGTDADVFIDYKTSASLIQNNIVERSHSGIMFNWGAAGNVAGYNYTQGEYHSPAPNFLIGGIDFHGAHPQFNLSEGNVVTNYYPDQVWGSSSHQTSHRDWVRGTTAIFNPVTDSGRAPTSTTGSWLSFQVAAAYNIAHLSWYYNFVNDVAGSDEQQSILTTHVPIVHWTSSAATRDGYASSTWNFAFGYGESADTGVDTGCDGGVAPCHSVDAYETSLIYNSYTYSNTTTNCTSGGSSSTCIVTDPPSYYLAAKPSWWGSLPWPGIGSDVTGGTGPGGHASLTASNPAMNCYINVMGGAEGGPGSPKTFNPSACGY